MFCRILCATELIAQGITGALTNTFEPVEFLPIHFSHAKERHLAKYGA